MFADLALAAGKAIRSAHPTLPRVLGGISPIDPSFMRNMQARGWYYELEKKWGMPEGWATGRRD